jgi:hypothetical protein
MQAGHSVLVTGSTARLPARPGTARPAARAPLPSPHGDRAAPGQAGMPPGRSQGQARMTLPAATAPDAEGRTPARGTQL